MMKKIGNHNYTKMIMALVVLLVLNSTELHAQGVAHSISKMQDVLANLKTQMMPLCAKLTGIGRGIAGLGALCYIAMRVWKHIANAEPIDFYPLFRPFVLGFCIISFPLVIKMFDGLMELTVMGTQDMVESSDQAVKRLLQMKKDAVKKTAAWQMYVGELNQGDKQAWLKYTRGLPNSAPDVDEGVFASIGSDISFAMSKASYAFRNSVKEWMSEILNVLFQAAALCINTLRTFQLIVLAIIGPLVFGLAVFDGFQHSLSAWLARYINVFLWLPVCNIFSAIIGKIQEEMLKLDLTQIGQTGDTFFTANDTAYLVFMIIGIVGYFTVPSIANFIVNGGGSGAMTSKVTSMLAAGGAGAAGGAMAAGGLGIKAADAISDINTYTSSNTGSGQESAGKSAADQYMKDQLKGSPEL